jgi:adenine-specific DNA glycosylase
MVKRPLTGLLAGQWEFPSTCVWTSEVRVAPDTSVVPNIALATRRKALNQLLTELFTDSNGEDVLTRTVWQQQRRIHESTVEHVFSHVRHTMWIEHKEIESSPQVISSSTSTRRKWNDVQGRQVRWMNADEMSKVGVTSGVKKILKVMEGKGSARAPPPTKKRRKET